MNKHLTPRLSPWTAGFAALILASAATAQTIPRPTPPGAWSQLIPAQSSGEGEEEGEGEGEGEGEYDYYDSDHDDGGGMEFSGDVDAPDLPGLPALVEPDRALNDADTASLAATLSAAQARCLPAAGSYGADCVGAQLREVALRLPESGPYAEARQALLKASDELSALVSGNVDRGKPVLVATGMVSGTVKTYRPVRDAALASINARATAILAEAQTTLLRSAGNSAERRVHYQRISAALETGKVLLRS